MHALIISILVLDVGLASAQVGETKNGERKAPEAVVWEYLETQFEKASMDATYWKRRWNLETNVRRNELRLGKAFSSYRLGADDLKLFVSSGDLLGSAFLTDVSYPVLSRDHLIGTVQVAEQDGQWTFVSRHLVGSPVDSMAVAFAAHGDSVATVGGDGIGAFMLIFRPAAPETRVYPMTRNVQLVRHADSEGTVSYRLACELLRPVAEQWLNQHSRREEEQRKE